MMGVRTLLRFLIGDRESILRIAADRSAIWIGLLFVLSAGLAREYDGEDLLREPWHTLIPLAASLLLSFLLFLPFWIRFEPAYRPALVSAYRAFLTLFWMTAPMAWLYAIPYERLLSATGSVRANMWTLALVAGWRVLLISRVLSVLTNRSFWNVFVVVLAVADAALQIAISFVPVPVLQFMGGVRLTESEKLIQGTTFLLRFFGMIGLLVLVPAALFALFMGRGAWSAVEADARQAPLTRTPVFYVALASLAVWIGILPLTQPEQQLRHVAERSLREGRISEGIELMSAHRREDFPPHWDPPPRVGYASEVPPLLDVMEALADGPDDWVRAVYLDKFQRQYLGPYAYYDPSAQRWGRVKALLDRMPEGQRLRIEHADAIERVERSLSDVEPATTQLHHGGD